MGLILSFATASLGFALVLVKDQSYMPDRFGKVLIIASITSLLLSIGLGLWCVINRLRDFRKTRGIARDREDWSQQKVVEDEISKRLEMRRFETKKLGETTWGLFRGQLVTFAFGAIALVAAVGYAYRTKLF